MSIIKYRAWDIDKQIMIDWETIERKRIFHDLVDNQHVMLMQCIGLCDITKTEIYDKDIVIADLIANDDTLFKDHIGLVTYCDFEWNLEMENMYWPVASWSCVEKCKIIGNIFESDDLVKSIVVPNIKLNQ